MRIVIAPDKFKGSPGRPGRGRGDGGGCCGSPRRAPRSTSAPWPTAARGRWRHSWPRPGGRFETRRVTGPLPEMKVDADLRHPRRRADRRGRDGRRQRAGAARSRRTATRSAPPPSAPASCWWPPRNSGVERDHPRHRRQRDRGRRHRLRQACGLPVILEGGEPVSPTEPLCGRDLDSRRPRQARPRQPGRAGEDHRRLRRDQSPLRPDRRRPRLRPAKGRDARAGAATGRLAAAIGRAPRQDERGRHPRRRRGRRAGVRHARLLQRHPPQRRRHRPRRASDCEPRLAGADLCLTGEGRLDASSLHGKAPVGVARLCKRLGVPCIAIVGSIGEGAEAATAEGIHFYLAIDDGTLAPMESMRQAGPLLTAAASRTLRRFLQGGTLAEDKS